MHLFYFKDATLAVRNALRLYTKLRTYREVPCFLNQGKVLAIGLNKYFGVKTTLTYQQTDNMA